MTVDECHDQEKENNPESMTISSNTSNPIAAALSAAGHTLNKSGSKVAPGKDFLNDSTSSSVPIAHLLPTKANTGSPAKASLSNEEVTGPGPVVATVNFVFSPVVSASGRPTFYSGSASASKVVKTPDSSSIQTRQSSRTPLGNSSKRKLDLNFQIDQLPDKDFVEITKPSAHQIPVAPVKQASGGRKSTSSLFKQPLTEHQKETRRHKSFIPMVMSSVCNELDATMDSQMSMMDDDTNTQSMMGMPHSQFASNPSNNSLSNARNLSEKSLLNAESSKAISQFRKVSKQKYYPSKIVQF
jgi:hypothetical protein